MLGAIIGDTIGSHLAYQGILSEKISEKNSGKKLTDRTIEKDLAALKDLGYLTREGGRKEGRWVVDMKV